MKMTDEQLQYVIGGDGGLAFTKDEDAMLERILYKVDHVDRRQKIKRKGIFKKVLLQKYTFEPAYADKVYRDFREAVFRKMVWDFFKDPVSERVDDLASKHRGFYGGYSIGTLICIWKRDHLKRIAQDVAKELKRA